MRGTRTTRTGKAASRARRPYVPPQPRFERQESDFVPLPDHLLSLRVRLRAVGHDLVRYSMDAATKEGAKYRHPPDEYEYAVHKMRPWISD